jgi:hypothetical protein
MANPADFLKDYIMTCPQEGGGEWEYIHSPYIRDYLSELSKEDAETFSLQVLTWEDDFHLYRIANDIIFCNNPHLRQDYLYARLFVKIENTEYLEYSLGNLNPTLHELRAWDSPTLQALADKITEVLISRDDYWKTHTHDNVLQMRELIASRDATAR